ncbi:unnamed protein product [Closterium sp. NIES-64]|nr:unnamed protein product [Closterium sp. NIES-64]
MMERGLWGLFDGTEKKPVNEDEIAAWKKKDQKTFATLISRIGINLVSSVRTCIKLEASAREAWKRLETMHVNKTLHGKILAQNAFYTVKLRAGESMHEYATRVEELGETLIDLGGSRSSDWTPSKVRDEEGNVHTASGEADDSKESLMLVAGNGNKTPSDAWFLDTGAMQHMTHSASLLNNIGAPGDVTSIVFGNNELLPVVGVGSTRLIVDSGPVDVTNVFHVPGVKVNLLSVPQLAKKDVITIIDVATMNLFWKGEQFAQGVLNGDIYHLKTYPRAASSNVAQGSKATLKAWHNRLAHANYESVKELANKGLAKGVDVVAGDDENGVCAACVEGKMARKPFGSRTSPLAKDPLALVHMDVCGPMRHASKGGARFLLVMLDDATRMCWTRLLKAEGDAAKAIQEWALDVCDDNKKLIKLQPKARAAIYLGIAANERAWRVWDLDEKRVVPSRDVVIDEDKFPSKEEPTQQLTFILPPREEVEESEVPSQVEKEAEEGGGGNNEESVDDVEEVSPTETATTSTPSSLPLALTRERREVRPPSKYADYATVAVGETDKEGVAYCFATGDNEHADSLTEPLTKGSPRACYEHVGLRT